MSSFTFLDRAQLNDLLMQAQEELSPFGVGFVKVEPTPQQEPALAGSGTLVVIDGVHGILTADHVLANLPTRGRLGLAFGSRTATVAHQFVIDSEVAPRVQVAQASGDDRGPDLGFLILPPDATSALKARASFYDITKRRDRMLSSPPSIEAGGWVVLGLIDEWTTTGPGELGFKQVRHFSSVCGGSAVSREEQREGFDYLYFDVRCDTNENRPYSFAGASGGSLWQLVARLEDERVSIKEALLSGVPFYESAVRDGVRTLVCHGRRSIYESVVRAVRDT